MFIRLSQRMAASVALVGLLAAAPANLSSADPAPSARTEQKASQRQTRLTAERLKKYDKNGDGELDQAERTAARTDRAKTRAAGTTPPASSPRGAGGEAKSSIGQKPLTEMTADDRVRGQDGGLYGGGRNEPTEALKRAAEKELARIEPLDAAGKPAPDGKVVLLSIGMSNTTREFTPFKEEADIDQKKSPNLVLVDGAFGGQGAAEWAVGEKSAGGGKPVWKLAEQRLQQSGVTREQVQAVWLKQAIKRPEADSMKNAETLRGHLATIVTRAKERYPNLRIVYLSSRTFGGYSERHGEPESFDTAFAVRRLILDQQAGAPELNYDPARGPVKAPLLVWGPYLWADGNVPRKSDGLVWLENDFVSDGTHPSPAGQRKVVDLLMNFFKTDPLAKGLYMP